MTVQGATGRDFQPLVSRAVHRSGRHEFSAIARKYPTALEAALDGPNDRGICIVDDYVAHEWAFVPHFYRNLKAKQEG